MGAQNICQEVKPFTKKWLLERESKFPFNVWHDPHFIRSPTFAGTTPVQILRSPLSHWLQARADSGGPKCIHRSCITSKRLSLFCVTMPTSQVRQGILGKLIIFAQTIRTIIFPGLTLILYGKHRIASLLLLRRTCHQFCLTFFLPSGQWSSSNFS